MKRDSLETIWGGLAISAVFDADEFEKDAKTSHENALANQDKIGSPVIAGQAAELAADITN